jgi:hypothetical protein
MIDSYYEAGNKIVNHEKIVAGVVSERGHGTFDLGLAVTGRDERLLVQGTQTRAPPILQ